MFENEMCIRKEIIQEFMCILCRVYNSTQRKYIIINLNIAHRLMMMLYAIYISELFE